MPSCSGGFGQEPKEGRDGGEFPEAPPYSNSSEGARGGDEGGGLERPGGQGQAWDWTLRAVESRWVEPVGGAEEPHVPTWAVTGSLSLLRRGDGAGRGRTP